MDNIINSACPLTKGIIYYTLKSCYPGDYTKNCGLLGTEIDGNFYFLRGHDIKEFSVEQDEKGSKILKLTRYDGEVLTGEIMSDDVTSDFKFDFNQDEGIITITYPNGDKIELGRFNTLKVSAKDTIKGNGSIEDPLRISEVERTGTYSPANELIDITLTDVMPDGSKFGKGYRIVTKENVTKYGLLYNYFEVMKISKALSTSPWRVPTKEDWDEMLNAIEPCESGQTHQDLGNRALGLDAGALLKQSGTTIWKSSGNEDDLGEDAYNFTALPLGFAGSRAGFLIDEDKDVEGYHICTNFWTNTPAGLVDKGEFGDSIYTKAFWFKTRKVVQEALAKNSRLSLRLVKDYNGNNFNAFEEILGKFYPCTHINATNGKYSHNKVWTSVNIGMSNFGGIPSHEWDELWYTEIDALPEGVIATEFEEIPEAVKDGEKYIKVKDKYYTLMGNVYTQNYFINEWDGKQWIKKMMNDGDSIVILSKLNDKGEALINHEWRIYRQNDGNDKLVDTVEALKDEVIFDFNNTIAELSGNVSSAITELSGNVLDTIAELSGNIENTIVELSGNVSSAITEIIESISSVSGNIENTIAELSGSVESTIIELSGNVSGAIVELSGNVSSAITEVIESMSSVSGIIESAITELSGSVESAITELSGNVEDTIIALSGNVENAILKEAKEREENDIASSAYTIGNIYDTIEIKNNLGEIVFSIKFDGNFGEIINN